MIHHQGIVTMIKKRHTVYVLSLEKYILYCSITVCLSLFCLSALSLFPRIGNAEIEEVVTGRKIQFLFSVYPYSTERGESLKGEERGIPKGIAIDPEGKLFAIFLERMKVQVFNPEGRFQYEFGEQGTGEGRFILPLDLEISSDGRAFLMDSRQQKILVYDNKGRFLSEFSFVKGLAEGEKAVTATKMGIDRKRGIIYIADNANSVIRGFSLEGEHVERFGRFGHGDGEFSFPGQVHVDTQGRIFVLDMANTRVQVFGPDKKYSFSFGGFGDSFGEFARPNAVVTDSQGRIYVLDRLLAAIQVFDHRGNILGVIKDLDEPNGLRNSAPFDMAIDQEDRLYISAQDYHSIKVIKDME